MGMSKTFLHFLQYIWLKDVIPQDFKLAILLCSEEHIKSVETELVGL